ncbi:MAG: glycerol kinase GlpK [Flavobacteriaceae bacterium]|jgi:glycerol kinase
MKSYILAIDAGTTSSRAIIFDKKGTKIATAQQEFQQYFPQNGWVEHDAEEIWNTQLKVIKEVVQKANTSLEEIAAIGITNQRETTVVWNKKTGVPVGKAIVWQDRRTSATCETLKQEGKADLFVQKTGLVLDAYFSGTKIKWILDQSSELRQQAEEGDLAFGTIDSWLIYKLTAGSKHITDVTNASRTLLFNIHELKWDNELMTLLDVPEKMMPEVVSSSEIVAHTDTAVLGAAIPISGIAGDQQSALFGQLCWNEGEVKNTYGTGCFCIMNTGTKAVQSKNKMLTTIAWKIGDQVEYAIEGSIFVAGALVQWLRDQLRLIDSAPEVEALASSVADNGGVTFIPALTGLGAPYWNPNATGAIIGLTRGTTDAHIARAALEAIALRSMEIIVEMQKDAGVEFSSLKVDGGASNNNLLMQIQADLLNAEVVRPKETETTAMGAAFLAGLAVGFWSSKDEIKTMWQEDKIFQPSAHNDAKKIIEMWNNRIEKVH